MMAMPTVELSRRHASYTAADWASSRETAPCDERAVRVSYARALCAGSPARTFEDEDGQVNLIVRPDLADRKRRELLNARLLGACGHWQSCSGAPSRGWKNGRSDPDAGPTGHDQSRFPSKERMRTQAADDTSHSARDIQAAELWPRAAAHPLLTFTRVSFVLLCDAPNTGLAMSVDDLEQSTARCSEVRFRRRGNPEQKAG
jgi:hypothetical protein